jgi:hypothetical protein
MASMSIKKIGEKLTLAGRLKMRPVCVYGSGTVPETAVPMNRISSCVARSILNLAMYPKLPPLYISEDTLEGCCGGGQAWFGFHKFAPHIKYFISTGTKEFRKGAAEYLRASPEIAEENIEKIGRITPPGKHLVIQACSDLDGEDPGVRSVLCFGLGEQIRNMCALVHFRIEDPFHAIIVPQGASCASFVTYASGMAEKAPTDAVVIGPCDPTGNLWFPSDHLSMAIPIKIARQMANDLEDSFITKRPLVAYPEKRMKIKAKSLLR